MFRARRAVGFVFAFSRPQTRTLLCDVQRSADRRVLPSANRLSEKLPSPESHPRSCRRSRCAFWRRSLRSASLRGGEGLCRKQVSEVSKSVALFSAGIPPVRRRSWVLSSARKMDASNVGAGLALWCQNLGSFFGGAEDCPICLSAVQPQFKTLPRSKCSTCRKKFHSECIYRWFRISKNTVCPHCRALI